MRILYLFCHVGTKTALHAPGTWIHKEAYCKATAISTLSCYFLFMAP